MNDDCKVHQIGNLTKGTKRNNPQRRRLYSTKGIAPCLVDYSGGGQFRASDSGARPLNPMPDGTCRTIKAQYQQSSFANFTRTDSFAATGVIEIE